MSKITEVKVSTAYEDYFAAVYETIVLPEWNSRMLKRHRTELGELQIHYGHPKSFHVVEGLPSILCDAIPRGSEQVTGADVNHTYVNSTIDTVMHATIALFDSLLQIWEPAQHGNGKAARKQRAEVLRIKFGVDVDALEIHDETILAACHALRSERGPMPPGLSMKAATVNEKQQGQPRLRIACPNVMSKDNGKAAGCGCVDPVSKRWVPMSLPIVRAQLESIKSAKFPPVCWYCGKPLVLADPTAIEKAKGKTVTKTAKVTPKKATGKRNAKA